MQIRRFFKKVHLWLSIPAGLIVSIVCLSGAALSFETEIMELCYPDRYFVQERQPERIPLDKLIPMVNKQLDNNSVASVKISSDSSRTYIATLSEGFRVSAFVNPYTGEVKGIHYSNKGFFHTMMLLHRWLLDGTRTWGKYTVGITTLLFVFILITGLIWWMPTEKRKVKSRFRVSTRQGMKRFLHDIHVSLGIYVFLFLLVCSLTGLMWSFDWYRNSVSYLLGIETNEGRGRGGDGGHRRGGGEKRERKAVDYTHWQEAYSNLISKAPRASYVTVGDGSLSVLDASAPHSRATDKYSFDSSTGEITKATLYADEKSSSKLMSWVYALHVGAYGGILFRILTCLACLIGGTLPWTGYYIFYQKSRRKKKKKEAVS